MLLIVLDDMGFADLGCYGSEIGTPRIDELATNGLRYNRFHATALCSPTRASLLTGRNHHSVGMGGLAFTPIAFPGYNGRIPKSAATLARHLRDTGFGTVAIGKWHLAPDYETGPAGPFERWPLGMGFEHYYGFLGGLASQWAPDLVRGNEFVDPPKPPEASYHLTEDLADQAIRFLQIQREATSKKPFFLYFAPGAMHFPHQVPNEWTIPYRHRFDEGWEALRVRTFERQREMGVVPEGAVLTERPPWVEPWTKVPEDDRALYARQMEVYAGYLTHTDAQIGRVLDYLSRHDLLADTLTVLISDNGASAEGGPQGWTHPSHHGAHGGGAGLGNPPGDRLAKLGGVAAYGHYAWGWAWAGNAPFRLWKRYAWLGGVRVPLIVHWPAGIEESSRGQVRAQFCHAVDIMPTVLAATGVEPEPIVDGVVQQDFDGESIAATFNDACSEGPRVTQYFEVLGSRSIVHQGWKATTDHIEMGNEAEREMMTGSRRVDEDRWSLYCLDDDYSEAKDLAAAYPDRLQQLTDLWWAEAGRNQVLPLMDPHDLVASVRERPLGDAGGRRRFTYGPGGGPIVTPILVNGFRAELDVEVPTGAQGVICAQGDLHSGWACYLGDQGLVLVFHLAGAESRLTVDPGAVAGHNTIAIDYEVDGEAGGVASVSVGETPVASGPVVGDGRSRYLLGLEKLLIGRDRGLPVSGDYRPPFVFTGVIHRVALEVPGASPADTAEPSMSNALRSD